MAKRPSTALVLVVVVTLAALGVALVVGLGRHGRSEANVLTLRSSAVLSSGDLGLWHDQGKTQPVTSLQFEGVALQPPLSSIVKPVDVFIENLSTADMLFLVKPCGAVMDSTTNTQIGTMDAVVHDLGGVRLGNTCDSPPTVRLATGDLVTAELNIELVQGLGSGDFGFETVFEAVTSTSDVPAPVRFDFITKWGSDVTGDGRFNGPPGIAVDGSGRVYVADTSNDRVQVFSGDGSFLGKWSSPGTGDGQFNRPWGIAVDGSGRVYVADGGNNRVQVFDANGSFLAKWGHTGRRRWPVQ